ncbi:transporter [Fulvitalea axinellae]|uniref:Transporter n=2 Tax=Fulvitalea axinellae TaxID=1182444 RepID=A0AAU9CR76_9BACT|nr:transporter [Fulvitalea axinellae]
MTLRNMPMMAITGMQMFFFNILTAFFFLIPVALVSAELATGWPKAEGVFHWVRIGFGDRIGFMATWLQWLQSMFGMASILAYIGTTIAYIVDQSLANNPWFIFFSIVAVYWILTVDNFFGTNISTKISSWALIIGVIFPTILLISFGVYDFWTTKEIVMNTRISTENLLPNLGEQNRLVMLMGFIFGYVGIEVSANDANLIPNPSKSYPKAIFSAVLLVFISTLLGALSIAIKIPQDQISESAGVMQIFELYLKKHQLGFITPWIAGLVAFGTAGQVSTWVIGPADGLHQASERGDFFSFFKKDNKYDVPKRLLIFQAIVLSVISIAVLLLNDVNTAFFWLTSLAVILYALMYILLFLTAIKLRYTHKDQVRPYRIPFGNIGIWIVSFCGLAVITLCLLVGFIPLDSVNENLKPWYPIIMGLMALTCVSVGLIIFHKSK